MIFGWSFLDILALIGKCIVVFLVGGLCYDIIHHTLHRFENSRFALLRKLGALHTVHHRFLDENMKIHREHANGNVLHHVIPENLTAFAVCGILGLVFGWLPAAIVFAMRLIGAIPQVLTKGEDTTHQPLKRVRARRSFLFVGAHYHALHHVYVDQHYASFVSLFDIVCGTGFQIRHKKFVILGPETPLTDAVAKRLQEQGGSVENMHLAASPTSNSSTADVFILSEKLEPEARENAIRAICDVGIARLVPPEVWDAGPKVRGENFNSDLMTYRSIAQLGQSFWPTVSPEALASLSLFLIRRGFRFVPARLT